MKLQTIQPASRSSGVWTVAIGIEGSAAGIYDIQGGPNPLLLLFKVVVESVDLSTEQ